MTTIIAAWLARWAGRLLVAVLAVTPIAALAQTKAPDKPLHQIVMSGEGQVTASPDQAVVSAGTVTDARTAADAVAQNSDIMGRAFDGLKALGIPSKAIQTTGFSLDPQYPPDDPKNPHKREIIGYEVTNSISVTLDDVTKAGAVLDALIDAGVNQSAGVSFSIKNPQPLLDQARALAAKDALNRATIYATAVGTKLGPVLSINEGYGQGGDAGMVETVVVTGSRRDTPIQAGDQSVSATVTVKWEIK